MAQFSFQGKIRHRQQYCYKLIYKMTRVKTEKTLLVLTYHVMD